MCDDERIAWVAGYCVSEAVKVTDATTEAVRLVWESEGGGEAASDAPFAPTSSPLRPPQDASY